MVRSVRREGLPTLLVDGGNFSPALGSNGWEKGSFVWELMAGLGYDAASPGDHDLYQGVDSLRALAARHPEICLLSANLLDLSGRRVLPESEVLTRDGVRFGVTAVIDSAFYAADRTKERLARDEFRFEGMEDALRRVVPQLRLESDVVVVLFHTRVGEVNRLLAAIPGIDVAVAGHDPGFVPDPERSAEAYVVRSGNRGQNLGILRLWLEPDTRRIMRGAGEGKALDDSVSMDPEVTARIDAFENRRSESAKP